MTNSMPNCTRYEGDLKAYADGELSPLRRRAVRRHLTHCASCQKEILLMTQITEDLRSADPAEALPPALRAKILAEPTPLRSSATLPKREGEEFEAAGVSEPLRPPVSGGPLRSNLLQSKEVGSRKRPILAWGLAGAALIAWFVCFPMLQKVRENARRVSTAQAHISDGDDSRVYVQIKQPARNGSAQTFAANPATADPDLLRQVHKEASLGIQVANPEAAGDTINAMVKETGGYVASNNLSTGSDGLKSGELIVKVPVTQFETFLAQVAKLGVVQSKNISGEDITEKTSDASQTEGVLEDDVQTSEARLKSLGAKAKWHDEQATRDLRIQLAQAQARLVLLKRMAALGTLTIELSQTPKAVVAPPVTGGFLNTLKATMHDALHSLIGSAGALLALVIWLLAYAPIWVPLLLIGRYALNEYRKREAA